MKKLIALMFLLGIVAGASVQAASLLVQHQDEENGYMHDENGAVNDEDGCGE